jgi:3-phosphoshikimate 1-carboxyvinyltransferase
MSGMSCVTVKPARSVQGNLRLPGDKSISHRYAMLASLAEGTSRFENFSSAADCASTLACIEQLGCTVRRDSAAVEVVGIGGNLRDPARMLDCGNSGSTMRMLAGILAAQPFRSEMIGDASLSRRPMKRIMEPLAQMGARITASEGNRPPLVIEGGPLRAITYKTPVASAQVKSCVLLAGLFADGETVVEEPIRTRDHTELALGAFGGAVKREGNRISIHSGQKLHALEAYVPGDISTATFFLCAAAMLPDSNLVIDHVLLNPTRAAILDVLAQLGLQIRFLKVEEQHGELIGSVHVQGGGCKGLNIAGETAALLIDELPMLAALGAYTQEGIDIRDARELRVKESDRITAVVENLRRMQVEVEEREDGLRVPGRQKPRGAVLESREDHRIAMAFSIAALAAEGESQINGAEAVAVSFPQFYETLDSVLQR